MGWRILYFVWSLLITLTSSLFYVLKGRWRHRNPYFDSRLPHHTPYGFRNTPDNAHPSRMALLKWSIKKLVYPKPAPPEDLRIPHKTDPAQQQRLAEPEQPLQATWLGHASVLVQQSGFNYITDPHFSDRASFNQLTGPRRLQPPPLAMSGLPRIDAVLVSHDHYDHLDFESVKALYHRPEKPHFYVPLGLEKWFIEKISYGNRERIHALDWWQQCDITASDGRQHSIFLVPAQHWSKRHLIGSNRTLWGGFVVQSPGLTSYFAGDTAYSPVYFRQIGEMFGPVDLALIPVGAYEPRAFMKYHHVNEMEAVKIFKDVQAQHGIGIHWGTFQLTDEPADAPRKVLPQLLREAGLPEDRFRLLHHGETVHYPR